MDQNLHSSPNEEIFSAPLRLLKKQGGSENLWRVGGIASSESMDEEGDVLLRKVLDLSYVSRRGYINWDHSRAPADQLGFTTVAEVIAPGDVGKYEDMLDTPLSKSSSVYVEGRLYQHVKRAQEVYDILKSIPEKTEGSLGLSVDGSMARAANKSVIKAMVRGVAVTPVPAHPETLCRLVKSLRSGVATAVEYAPVTGLSGTEQLTFDGAVVLVQRIFPGISFAKAEKMVKSIFEQT